MRGVRLSLPAQGRNPDFPDFFVDFFIKSVSIKTDSFPTRIITKSKETQGHLIFPPTDQKLRAQLTLKLKEYEERIAGKGKPWEYWHPEQAHLFSEDYRDSCYKAYVLKAVLSSD